MVLDARDDRIGHNTDLIHFSLPRCPQETFALVDAVLRSKMCGLPTGFIVSSLPSEANRIPASSGHLSRRVAPSPIPRSDPRYYLPCSSRGAL